MEDVLVRLAEAGVRAVVLREKDLPPDERRRLLERAQRRLAAYDVRLLVGTSLDHDTTDQDVASPWVHLPAGAPFPTPRPEVVGRSCHGAREVRRAAEEACDYVTISPGFPSASKPGYGPCLGTPSAASCRSTSRPAWPQVPPASRSWAPSCVTPRSPPTTSSPCPRKPDDPDRRPHHRRVGPLRRCR
ncbi:thiamine phosphate synthase [Nocardioides marmoribigeumensis]|uniref:thiamine phosphate synthase n=1 Tax=Nocardioides marmoribigeumensis TaxID=433649 RepID=UPI00286BEFA1|nr:thiamine phosphate synthase [Nocardioides marmoribigeumensis]